MITRRGSKKGALSKTVGAVLLTAIFILQGSCALGATPWPQPPSGQDPLRYEDYCRSPSPPGDYDKTARDGWQLSGDRGDNTYLSLLQMLGGDLYRRELQGVMGASVDRAWSVTTGRPDVTIAVLDSGIRWHDAAEMADLAGKIYLNGGEIPPPQGAGNWDANGDGVFNVEDYAGDPRVADANGNGILDPQDLIRAFSDGEDDDGNGYTDDVSGWDFLEDDNDPWDETDYGHGTVACRLSCAEAGNGAGTPGACPNAMALVVRLGDPDRVDAGEFAQGVVFAVDSGAEVVQAGITACGNTSFGQAAIDYAWAKGVSVVTCAGVGESAARVYPGACERTVPVNASAAYLDGSPGWVEQFPSSYLYLGNRTGFGPQTALSCPSEGDSSGAAGRTAGIAGLLYSAAMDRAQRGEMWLYPGTEKSLSACEVKQLLCMTADDIDFSPHGHGTSFGSLDDVIGSSYRYPTNTGWDPYTGYGRVNACEAVRAVSEGRIPPEAEIRSPRWFEQVEPGQASLEIDARLAAVRADSFQYTVEWGAGEDPGEGEWRTLASSEPHFDTVEGVVATLDLGEVHRTLQEAAEAGGSSEDPGSFTFTIRVRVMDNRGVWGEDRKTLFCHKDPDAYPGAPVRMGSGVSGSPRFSDLDGDGADELIVAADDGLVHAFREDLSELEGYPVHTTQLALHLDSAAFRTGALPSWAYASAAGTPAVGDLGRDGTLEVVAGDSEGRIYAWDRGGRLLPGFPVRSHPLYSIPDRADWWTEGSLPSEWYGARFTPDSVHRLDRHNRLDRGFSGGPVLSNLDGSSDGSLEIVAACSDQHLYAWHLDGNPVRGWPVKLADPDRVAGLDPLTHACRFADRGNASEGSGILSSPAVADLEGDGSLEVVCGTAEVYADAAASQRSFGLSIALRAIAPLLGAEAARVLEPGSGRVYAVRSEGTACGLDQGAAPAPETVPAGAYLEGWPARLPTAAAGTGRGRMGACGPPVVADVDGDGRMETGVAAAGGPVLLLEEDGTSHLGNDECGRPLSLECDQPGDGAESRDLPLASTPGGGCFALLDDSGVSYVAPTMGIGCVLDLLLPAEQVASDDQVSAWSAVDGGMLPAFPRRLRGAMLSGSPAAADLDGDGFQEIIAASSCGDISVMDGDGKRIRGWPKLTGGWAAGAPCVGDFDGDGNLELAAGTREGWLLLWKTGCSASRAMDWPQAGHDTWGTGWLDADAAAPGRVEDLAGEMLLEEDRPVGVKLTWTAPGDDGARGQALCYDIRYLDRPIDESNWDEAVPLGGKPLPAGVGNAQEMDVRGSPFDSPEGKAFYFALRTRDEAGNLSPISGSCKI